MQAAHYRAIRPDGSTLHLAPLTDRLIEAAGDDVQSPSGHYLYECSPHDPNDIRIIAHVPLDEAAFELSRMLSLEAAA